uniref:Uncharacterized protein n=1 Tax=Glossina palpalis gambiensis TaxID=67801 RepID=A0A1B0BD42_9MUSC
MTEPGPVGDVGQETRHSLHSHDALRLLLMLVPVEVFILVLCMLEPKLLFLKALLVVLTIDDDLLMGDEDVVDSVVGIRLKHSTSDPNKLLHVSSGTYLELIDEFSSYLAVAILTSSTRLSAKPLTSYNVGLSRFVVICSFQQLPTHHDGVRTTTHYQRVNADAEKKCSFSFCFSIGSDSCPIPYALVLVLRSSKFPDIALFKAVLMRNDVRTTANKVALKNTVPSEFNGIFIDTKRLQAIRCGHNLPNPKGGEIFLNNVTTSKCLIRPLASGSYSDQRRMNSSK